VGAGYEIGVDVGLDDVGNSYVVLAGEAQIHADIRVVVTAATPALLSPTRYESCARPSVSIRSNSSVIASILDTGSMLWQTRPALSHRSLRVLRLSARPE
jgi:hypothetical protein